MPNFGFIFQNCKSVLMCRKMFSILGTMLASREEAVFLWTVYYGRRWTMKAKGQRNKTIKEIAKLSC